MICLSQTTGYAIRALVCLESTGSRPSLVRDMAACAGIPKPYLARIVNLLARRGLVSTKRGYQGGITLARPASTIAILEVVEAVEGEQWIGPCLLGISKSCAGFVCPTHEFWQGIRHEIREKLRTTTLGDLIQAQAQIRSRGCQARSAPSPLPKTRPAIQRSAPTLNLRASA